MAAIYSKDYLVAQAALLPLSERAQRLSPRDQERFERLFLLIEEQALSDDVRSSAQAVRQAQFRAAEIRAVDPRTVAITTVEPLADMDWKMLRASLLSRHLIEHFAALMASTDDGRSEKSPTRSAAQKSPSSRYQSSATAVSCDSRPCSSAAR